MISFYRYYHMSCALYNLKKQGMKLCKMVNPKTKRQWYPQIEAPAMPSLKSLTKVKNEPGKRGIRRMAMLNKMFMKQITDMMSTGTVAMDIVGRGIEISKVNISPDFQRVNVFWVCKGDTTDEETETLLNKTAGALRHELSTLRVMGQVPYISFVKDHQEARLVDLDRCLAAADYGEDFKATDMGHILKSEFTLVTKLSAEMKAKIQRIEEELPIEDDAIPEMTHNVYGLDHAKIMSRLLAARKKSRDAWQNLGNDSVISYRVSQESKPPEVNTTSQSKELAEFLQKRQILQNKLSKQLRSSNVDWMAHDKEDDNEEEIIYDDEYEDELFYEEDDFYQENSQYEAKDSKSLN
ncbi:hypothetical protein O3G_MSEX009762 [Manduca sexta]|uniref:Ribosome-binding factor A, mitochondrial n=1 Tax=Manduca sexta TaxID=7130 RepID=A0A922CSA3_MANSE|nr:hypothetical protein O3G_MSEX009762 [Manduca sexta]